MRCPKCGNKAAPFIRWACWPGPKRTCLSCGSRLRYKNFYREVGLHALGAAVFFAVCAWLDLPVWVLLALLLTTMPITGIVCPWYFGRYELTE